MHETGDSSVLLPPVAIVVGPKVRLAALALVGGLLALHVSGPGRISFDGARESDD